MPTKKTATKKVTPEKVAKEVKAPKAEKKTAPKKSTVTLVQFECAAIIPTQQYGNIQPKITVTAGTIEEAKNAVMPMIVELYQTYAEEPLNGRAPKFFGHVTVTEKVVEPKQASPKVEAPATESSPEVSVQSSSESTPQPTEPVSAPTAAAAPTESIENRPEPFKKAHKAISLANSRDALGVIETQINNSVKIAPADKPELIRFLIDRRNAMPF